MLENHSGSMRRHDPRMDRHPVYDQGPGALRRFLRRNHGQHNLYHHGPNIQRHGPQSLHHHGPSMHQMNGSRFNHQPIHHHGMDQRMDRQPFHQPFAHQSHSNRGFNHSGHRMQGMQTHPQMYRSPYEMMPYGGGYNESNMMGHMRGGGCTYEDNQPQEDDTQTNGYSCIINEYNNGVFLEAEHSQVSDEVVGASDRPCSVNFGRFPSFM